MKMSTERHSSYYRTFCFCYSREKNLPFLNWCSRQPAIFNTININTKGKPTKQVKTLTDKTSMQSMVQIINNRPLCSKAFVLNKGTLDEHLPPPPCLGLSTSRVSGRLCSEHLPDITATSLGRRERPLPCHSQHSCCT